MAKSTAAKTVRAKKSVVMKAKAVKRTFPAGKNRTKKVVTLKRVRVGILVGKDFDPVKKGTHDPNYPKKYVLSEDDWGKYQVDVSTALKMQELHPDLLEIDIIQGKEVSEKRLLKNHVNLNFWYDVGCAMVSGRGKRHVDDVMKAHMNPKCHLDPSWDYYNWIINKPRYMEQCMKAGIPMIPTIIYKNGLRPEQCLKDVQKKGWEKIFIKVGSYAFFGDGAIHGKTADFLGPREKNLRDYAASNQGSKIFLVQPYMLKPNGEVFDEVRNFFIDGQWRYSVFTHGTDGSDSGYYQEPDGPRKMACKALAEQAYQQVLKVCKWQGKRVNPLLNRIDIGVIPKKGGISLHRTDNTYFVNEIEMIMTTWLERYAPISVHDVMAHASVKHTLELLAVLLKSKKKMRDEADVRAVARMLNARVGPFKHLKI